MNGYERKRTVELDVEIFPLAFIESSFPAGVNLSFLPGANSGPVRNAYNRMECNLPAGWHHTVAWLPHPAVYTGAKVDTRPVALVAF